MAKTRKRRTKPVGYTKTKGKYALVFRKNGKMSVGSGRYKTRTALINSAKKYLK